MFSRFCNGKKTLTKSLGLSKDSLGDHECRKVVVRLWWNLQTGRPKSAPSFAGVMLPVSFTSLDRGLPFVDHEQPHAGQVTSDRLYELLRAGGTSYDDEVELPVNVRLVDLW